MVRVCPKRDAICPHGMGCKFTIDRYQCADETNPMTETPTNTGAVGAEYVLVPREPTEEMVKASCRALYAAHRRDPAHKV